MASPGLVQAKQRGSPPSSSGLGMVGKAKKGMMFYWALPNRGVHGGHSKASQAWRSPGASPMPCHVAHGHLPPDPPECISIPQMG